MAIGVVMAGVVIFGHDRVARVSEQIDKFDASQAAFESLNAAAKRVQYIYSSESGCDPRTLNQRLSAMSALPVNAADMGSTVVSAGSSLASYAVAQPTLTNAATRVNRCETATGCRQIAVPIDATYYIVTVGAVSRDPVKAATGRTTTDCPRDASVKLSVAVDGVAYTQRFTLTNLCTLASCNCITGDCTTAEAGFSNMSLTVTTNMVTTTCTGVAANILSRRYGSIVSAGNNVITTNDLRWGRTYLETGGGGTGDTTFINATGIATYTSGAFTISNGACSPTLSAGQCTSQPCFPAFDLNRDGNNNEADIAILEHYLRGYLTSLPVNELQ